MFSPSFSSPEVLGSESGRLIITEVDKGCAALSKAHVVSGDNNECTSFCFLYEKRFDECAIFLIQRGCWFVGENDRGLAIY